VKTAEEYMQRLPEFDAEMSAKLQEAQASGDVLRYVGVVDVKAGKGSVELRRYPASHPFAQLQGSDNIIAFTTARYGSKQPLIVRGPGAGAAVTAGMVWGGGWMQYAEVQPLAHAKLEVLSFAARHCCCSICHDATAAA
jgi:aspartokinase/homoserine dehydrogenase 1